MSSVSTGVARPLRTVAQGGAGWVIVECLEAFSVYDFTERQYGLAVFVLGGVVSALQNLAENKGWIKAFLRTVPQPDEKVVDEVGHP